MSYADFQRTQEHYTRRAIQVGEKLHQLRFGERSVDEVEFEPNLVRVTFYIAYRGSGDNESVVFQSDVMDLPESEVDAWCEATIKRKEEERQKREAGIKRQQAKEKAIAKRLAESKERNLFEKLKQKYEPAK